VKHSTCTRRRSSAVSGSSGAGAGLDARLEACGTAGAGAGLLAGAAAGRAGRLGPPPLPPPVVRVTRRQLSSGLWTRRCHCRRSVERDVEDVAHQTDCEGVLFQQRVLSCEPSSPQVSTYSHHLRLPGEPAGWGRCRWDEVPPWGSAPPPLPRRTRWRRHWRRRPAPGAAAARASLTSRWLHRSMPAHQDGHAMRRTFAKMQPMTQVDLLPSQRIALCYQMTGRRLRTWRAGRQGGSRAARGSGRPRRRSRRQAGHGARPRGGGRWCGRRFLWSFWSL